MAIILRAIFQHNDLATGHQCNSHFIENYSEKNHELNTFKTNAVVLDDLQKEERAFGGKNPKHSIRHHQLHYSLLIIL